jgi:hypothetical protein
MNHPNTEIEGAKWGFGPTSVIPCHNCVGAVAYMRRKRSLKVKLLSVPKRPVQNASNRRRFSLTTYKFIPECFGAGAPLHG